MLLITPINGLGAPGLGAANASVEQLQRALVNLAVATGRPAINPGKVSGTIDDATMIALGAAIGLLSEELPNYVYLPLQATLLVGVTNATAKQYVTQYAPQITVAINTAAVKFKTSTPAPTAGTVITQPAPVQPSLFDKLFPVGWYTRPSWGWLILAAGGFATYKLVTK